VKKKTELLQCVQEQDGAWAGSRLYSAARHSCQTDRRINWSPYWAAQCAYITDIQTVRSMHTEWAWIGDAGDVQYFFIDRTINSQHHFQRLHSTEHVFAKVSTDQNCQSLAFTEQCQCHFAATLLRCLLLAAVCYANLVIIQMKHDGQWDMLIYMSRSWNVTWGRSSQVLTFQLRRPWGTFILACITSPLCFIYFLSYHY